MCPTKKTTYHCGYVPKTLVFPCYFGATLYRVADDHAPIFCLHDLTVDESILLKSHEGISRSSSHLPPLKTLSSSGSPLTDINMGVYKQILQLTIKYLQDELYLLEVNAVNACMDDVGWVLPNEENARSRLEPIMTLRLVQPERKSGTSRREAFKRGAR